MNTKVTIKYDGSQFNGWQSQKNQPDVKTVEACINAAVSALNKKPTKVIGSGRTDRGVHALAQVFNFDNIHNIPMKRLKFALNNLLPASIEVIDCEEVNDEFHARYSAKTKEYHYHIHTGSFDLFKNNYITYLKGGFDLEIMKKTCELFIGTHDFTNFNATELEVKANQVVTISRFDIIENDETLAFIIEGSNFLRYMVRMLIGSVYFVGLNRLEYDQVKRILDDPTLKQPIYKMPANGLYLAKVNY